MCPLEKVELEEFQIKSWWGLIMKQLARISNKFTFLKKQ